MPQHQPTHADVGYEAATILQVADLSTYAARRSTEVETAREQLFECAMRAMTGRRSLVPHIEQRVGGGEVVAMCPLAEMLGEVMRTHVVAGALVSTLRYSQCPEVATLRRTIASQYADTFAVRVAALGGVQ